MTIFYPFDNNIYGNITNRCCCNCDFCIRKNGDGVSGSNSLWLEYEPELSEIIEAFQVFPKDRAEWVVFCGYGEPMSRADVLIKTAEYIKKNSGLKIRVNTNGLIGLMNPEFDPYSMKGLIDAVSISLNASDPEKYLDITNPSYGLVSYYSMLGFAAMAKSIVPKVTFTIVDNGLDEKEISACKERAAMLGIPLRIRQYITNNENYQ